MYEEHYVFIPPEEDDAKIWRYMDFTKFVSILDRRALFFVRSDKLSVGHEGSYSYCDVKARCDEYKGDAAEAYLKRLPKVARDLREAIFINCWHLSTYESEAMWNLYAKNEESIAIQSTYKKLKECFDSSSETIFIGKVSYIDYDTERMPKGNLLYPFVHKRKNYEHEKELRAVIMKLPSEKGRVISPNQVISGSGLYVNIDIDKLIECVYVSPKASDWFYDLIKSIIIKSDYGFDVLKSDLCRSPRY